MRPLRSLLTAVVVLSPLLLPATSMAGKQTGCDTGPAPTPDATNSPRTQICSDSNWQYCCASGKQWDLACVEQADAAQPATVADCGRDAWNAIQIPNTQQYFPRDFNVVALDGYIMGIVDVDDPIAAAGSVTAKFFNLNRLQREPWAVISNAVSLCSGKVSGNVSHPSATNTYNDKCALGNVTYNPTGVFGPQGNLTTSFFDFSAAKAKMWAMSAALSGYENQITAAKSKTTDTTLTFTGKYPDINVFNVDAKWLSGTTSFVFSLPQPTPPAAPASVIVNIIPDKASASGTTALPISISNAGISSLIGGQSGKMAPGNLLWNIPAVLGSTAILSNLTISSTGFVGSLLAPNTVVNLNSTNVTGTIVASSVQMTSSEPHSAPYHVPASQLALAKQYIKHVVVIMQENRSFDNYFGTFQEDNGQKPNGISTLTGQDVTNTKATCDLSKDSTGAIKCACKVDANGAYAPYHNGTTIEPNFPHYFSDFAAQPSDTDQQRDSNRPAAGQALETANFLHTACVPGQGDGNHNTQPDLIQALGYHTDAEIPNYWNLAKSFVLQDRMFASAPSYSAVEHTFMVSGWNASGCETTAGCVEAVDTTHPYNHQFLWNDITNLLAKDSISWQFYLGENWAPSCPTAASSPKDCFTASDEIAGFWNPYNQKTNQNSFKTVVDNQQTGNVMNLRDFFIQAENSDTSDGRSFPQVSWIVPGFAVSEHADGSYPNNTVDIKNGHAYVASIITAIMKHRTLWESTAIFLSWDDWGGFYDHVQPPSPYTGSTYSYGFRVPGLLITPWVKSGTIDNWQTLSHDAYLKLMEDIFLGKKGIGSTTGKVGTKDNRTATQQRDNAQNLGDLVTEFDFSHTPLAPISLRCNP